MILWLWFVVQHGVYVIDCGTVIGASSVLLMCLHIKCFDEILTIFYLCMWQAILDFVATLLRLVKDKLRIIHVEIWLLGTLI